MTILADRGAGVEVSVAETWQTLDKYMGLRLFYINFQHLIIVGAGAGVAGVVAVETGGGAVGHPLKWESQISDIDEASQAVLDMHTLDYI